MGKLHRKQVVTVAFSGVTKNDLIWAGVCHGRLGRIFQALSTQTDTTVVLIYKISANRNNFFLAYLLFLLHALLRACSIEVNLL